MTHKSADDFTPSGVEGGIFDRDLASPAEAALAARARRQQGSSEDALPERITSQAPPSRQSEAIAPARVQAPPRKRLDDFTPSGVQGGIFDRDFASPADAALADRARRQAEATRRGDVGKAPGWTAESASIAASSRPIVASEPRVNRPPAREPGIGQAAASSRPSTMAEPRVNRTQTQEFSEPDAAASTRRAAVAEPRASLTPPTELDHPDAPPSSRRPAVADPHVNLTPPSDVDWADAPASTRRDASIEPRVRLTPPRALGEEDAPASTRHPQAAEAGGNMTPPPEPRGTSAQASSRRRIAEEEAGHASGEYLVGPGLNIEPAPDLTPSAPASTGREPGPESRAWNKPGPASSPRSPARKAVATQPRAVSPVPKGHRESLGKSVRRTLRLTQTVDSYLRALGELLGTNLNDALSVAIVEHYVYLTRHSVPTREGGGD